MSVRDRYDVGKEKLERDERVKGYVRQMVQQDTAFYTWQRAVIAVRAGTACPFALDLVQAWNLAEQGVEL